MDRDTHTSLYLAPVLLEPQVAQEPYFPSEFTLRFSGDHSGPSQYKAIREPEHPMTTSKCLCPFLIYVVDRHRHSSSRISADTDGLCCLYTPYPYCSRQHTYVQVNLTFLSSPHNSTDYISTSRLYIIYPPRMTAYRLLAIIFIPLGLFKILRVINYIIFMAKYGEAVSAAPGMGQSPSATFQTFWNSSPYAKIEWFMEVFDNWYVS